MAFAKDLGTGLFNRESIKCKAWIYNKATKAKTAWSGVTNCIINFGGGVGKLHRTAYVELQLDAAMNAGTTYAIDLYGLLNPAIQEVLSELTLVTGEISGTVKTYTNTMYESGHIYTSNVVSTVETAQTLPTISPTTI